MRVLLDNCIPWRLARSIPGHTVVSVIPFGWAALSNGHLLEATAGKFDVLVTMDKGIHTSNVSTAVPSASSCCERDLTAFRTCFRSYRRCFRPSTRQGGRGASG